MANWDDYSTYTTPADDDTALLHDVSETTVGAKMKRITWANIKATLKTYFDTFYLAITNKATGSDVTTGTDDSKYVTSKAIADAGGLGGGGGASTPPGRLTLESGVPVSTSDQADKTTLYYTPYVGNQIMLYDGSSAWETIDFTELSLDISGFTASKPYDIFCYNNSGTATLEGLVWTDATTRATALTYQDGRLVKTGATTRLYLGTIYMDAASKCQFTAINKSIWNMYNQVDLQVMVYNGTGHGYTGTDRKWNNSDTNNLLKWVIGITENNLLNVASFFKSYTDGTSAYVAFKYDGTTFGDTFYNANAQYVGGSTSNVVNLAPGHHYLQCYEQGGAGGDATFGSMRISAFYKG